MKLKSHDDIKEFIQSGKKVDSSILRRSVVRTDKRSAVATVTDKISAGSGQVTSKVNLPQATAPISKKKDSKSPQDPKKKKSNTKEVLTKPEAPIETKQPTATKQPALPFHVDPKQAIKQPVKAAAAQKPAEQPEKEPEEPPYNKEVLMAKLAAIISLNPINQ